MLKNVIKHLRNKAEVRSFSNKFTIHMESLPKSILNTDSIANNLENEK